MSERIDISGKIGPLFPIHSAENPAEWPMYSYDRPASILWDSIADRLTELGWTEERVKTWLQSKETRWALDGSLGDALVMIGRLYAEAIR